MFEAVELGRRVTKEDYDKEVPELRLGLLKAQWELHKSAKTSVIVLVSGVEGAGKAPLIHKLNEWFDPRGVSTRGFSEPSDEELERPRYWQFWRAMPPRGRVAIWFGSWYTDPIIRAVYGDASGAALDTELGHINRLERMLTDDGIMLLKFWLHIKKGTQKKRLLAEQKDRRDLVTKRDWRHHRLYDAFRETSARALRTTDTAEAPWLVVEAEDDRYRNLTVGRSILETLRRVLEAPAETGSRPAPVAATPTLYLGADSVLGRVDLAKTVSPKKYARKLDRRQDALAQMLAEAHRRKISTVLVFEGWDAAGKGGTIRRVTEAIDPRLLTVVPIAAPTDEERAHHYMWRFWRHLPRGGRTTIFDRSWYGRVLVERVEGFAKEAEWRRAYEEINDFEAQLVEHGTVLLKFWLHLSPEEQLRRFKERQEVGYKQHKITEEDWRNRGKWADYEAAVSEMVARTSTELAPWVLVPSNSKRIARLEVLKAVNRTLAARLRRA